MAGSSKRTMVFLLEEYSARVFLEEFIFRAFPVLDDWETRFIVFEGKRDLERRLTRKLEGWLLPNTAFVVLRDRDSEDCRELKQRLVSYVASARRIESTLVRIACGELESWYLGQLAAVGVALQLQNIERQQGSRKYRNPDRLNSPSEELKRLTQLRYQKVSGSREIGRHLSCVPGDNLSVSFRAFVTGVGGLIQRMSAAETR